jgi:hypothetical protein
MVDTATQQMYIEELMGGYLAYIEDDRIIEEVSELLRQHNISNITHGAATPDKPDDERSL